MSLVYIFHLKKIQLRVYLSYKYIVFPCLYIKCVSLYFNFDANFAVIIV